MQITTQRLRQIIKEELQKANLNEQQTPIKKWVVANWTKFDDPGNYAQETLKNFAKWQRENAQPPVPLRPDLLEMLCNNYYIAKGKPHPRTRGIPKPNAIDQAPYYHIDPEGCKTLKFLPREKPLEEEFEFELEEDLFHEG